MSVRRLWLALRRVVGLLLLVAGAVCGIVESAALAEEGASDANQRLITVHLRGVRAAGSEGDTAKQFSEGLQDVSAKLGELPFARFTLVTNQEVTVPLHRKQSFPFWRHHTVTVRPIEEREGALSLWISWRDERGGKVLDTRVLLANGEQMIAGTDSDASGGGTILVVSAR